MNRINWTRIMFSWIALGVLGLFVFGGTPSSAQADSTSGAWFAFPSKGLNSSVLALAAKGKDIFVGGGFSRTQNHILKMSRIARFNVPTNTWSALPHNGLNDAVRAIAVIGDYVYVGGEFRQTQDGKVTNLNHIARFNTKTNTWSALPHKGLDGPVYAFAKHGTDLYVGGLFLKNADGVTPTLLNIAKFNTVTNTWSALPNGGVDALVHALAFIGNDLYVGGGFYDTADHNLTNLNRIVKFDTVSNQWSPLPHQGLNAGVNALAVSGTSLYVGGAFTKTADQQVTNLNYIARYDTTTNTWLPLAHGGVDQVVFALAAKGNTLAVGGRFIASNDGAVVALNKLAQYDSLTETWSALSHNGLDDDVEALMFRGKALYVGGLFTHTGDGVINKLNRIAKYK